MRRRNRRRSKKYAQSLDLNPIQGLITRFPSIKSIKSKTALRLGCCCAVFWRPKGRSRNALLQTALKQAGHFNFTAAPVFRARRARQLPAALQRDEHSEYLAGIRDAQSGPAPFEHRPHGCFIFRGGGLSIPLFLQLPDICGGLVPGYILEGISPIWPVPIFP